MNNVVINPYEYFADPTKGRPIFNGFVYIGEPDTDPEVPANQKQVYARQEDGNDVAIPQPVLTNAGGYPTYNGSVVIITVQGPYSVKVNDKQGNQLLYQANVSSSNATVTATPSGVSKTLGEWTEYLATPETIEVTATGTTTARSLADRFADTVHVKDEGAQPYPFDSTTAIDLAMAKAASMRAYVDLDNLALKYVGSLNIPDGVKGIKGGSSTKCWFGTLDDKKFLKDGEQHNLTGAILFSGAFDTFNTTRSDQFSSFTYMVKQSSRLDLDNVAFLQDMLVLDSNDDFTTPGNEGYSSCDVGFLIDDVGSNTYTNKCVWGYFNKAGTVIYSKSGNDDPDYNTFNGGSTYGRIGLALIANDVGSAYGLSGTTCFGYKIGSLDHHSRSLADAATLYANADTWRCIYIDGDVEPSSTAEINGHYFTNCVLRTRSDTIIELDHASNVVFTGGVIESAKYGVPNSTQTAFKGSVNTKKGVQFYGVRINDTNAIYCPSFAGTIPEQIIVTGDPVDGKVVISAPDPTIAGGYSFSAISVDSSVGDPFVLFGKNVNNFNQGWKILRDLSDSDKLNFRFDANALASLDTTGKLKADTLSLATQDVSFTPFFGLVAPPTYTKQEGRKTIIAGICFIDIVLTYSGLDTADASPVVIDGLDTIDNDSALHVAISTVASTGLVTPSTIYGSATGSDTQVGLFSSADGVSIKYNGGRILSSGTIKISVMYRT